MKLQVLYDLARILPLTAWSGSASILALATSLYAVGFSGIHWPLAGTGVALAVLLQYVAHPLNDLVDYPVDVRANIAGTGRRKVLVSGLVSVRELKLLSFSILAFCALLVVPIAVARPYGVLVGVTGFLAIVFYNFPPLQLSHRPFPELLIGLPIDAAIVVGIAYVATGQILPLAVALGLIQGLVCASAFSAYFAMDFFTDMIGGKKSTIVAFPDVSWCSLYTFVGFLISLVSAFYLLTADLFAPGLAALLAVAAFLALLRHAVRIDGIWQAFYRTWDRWMKTDLRDPQVGGRLHDLPSDVLSAWERASSRMRQDLVSMLYVTIGFGAGASAILILGSAIASV